MSFGDPHWPGYPSNFPSFPSHITHSWGYGGGMGGPDPLAQLAKAMDRLAAAIERHNELADQK